MSEAKLPSHVLDPYTGTLPGLMICRVCATVDPDDDECLGEFA